MAETQHSIRVVKAWPYRGNPVKQYSNRYHFDGGSPGDSTAWHALMDAVVLLEQSLITGAAHVIECVGYAPGSQVPVAQKAYTAAGTLSAGTGVITPGQCAIVARAATTKISRKNHTVYVFSYFHQAISNWGADQPDAPLPAQKTAVENYMADWVDGFAVGGRTYKRTTPDGHATTNHLVEPWIGHRDFPH